MAYEDQEQLDAIKKWWQENRIAILGGIAAVAVGFFGYNFWESSKNQKTLEASQQYQVYQAASFEDKTAALETLQEQFSSESYAALASLSSASEAVALGDLEQAETTLRWVSENATEELKGLADIRLAKVLWQLDKVNQALTVLDNVDSAYQALASELKGDIFSSQSQWSDAVIAYENAISIGGLVDEATVKMKLDYVKSAG